MKQSDVDYLKGFTMLQTKDALGEAWAILKGTCPACGGDGIQHPKKFQAPCTWCDGTGRQRGDSR